MNRSATITIVGLVLVLLVFNYSRFTRNTGEPAVLREPTGVWVQLGQGFPDAGMLRQFSDESTLEDVINLTEYAVAPECLEKYPINMPVESGCKIDLILQGIEIQTISLSWISAGQRIVLGIPLHPDRMTQKDWEYLPGIGEKMAIRISVNRQNNGDFGSFERLRRVKGVGSSKLAVWKEFF